MSKPIKLRVSQHSGREGSAKHNDRSFLNGRSDTWIQEHANNIDRTRSNDNVIITWDDQQDIETSERAWYAQAYGEAQEATNARYIRERHPERCKTTDQLYEGKQSRPEEMILQIGDMNSGINPEAFEQAAIDYLNQLNEVYGEHMHILSAAFHYDEASPHAHVRRVWDYTDKDGLTRPGQDKALEAMDIALPEPSKPKGRYNNRKMTFDKAARELWQEVCRAHGFDIETEPRPDRKHKDKAEFIRDQIAREIDQAKQQAREATQRAKEAQQRAAQADKEAREATQRAKKAGKEAQAIDLGLMMSWDQAIQASQEADKANAKAKAAQTAQKQAEELLSATRDDLRGTTERLDTARQELNAIERQKHILTATAVKAVESKPAFLDKTKVMVGHDDLRALQETAALVDQVRQEIDGMTKRHKAAEEALEARRRDIDKAAKKSIAEAQKQASKLLQEAQEQAAKLRQEAEDRAAEADKQAEHSKCRMREVQTKLDTLDSQVRKFDALCVKIDKAQRKINKLREIIRGIRLKPFFNQYLTSKAIVNAMKRNETLYAMVNGDHHVVGPLQYSQADLPGDLASRYDIAREEDVYMIGTLDDEPSQIVPCRCIDELRDIVEFSRENGFDVRMSYDTERHLRYQEEIEAVIDKYEDLEL